MLGVWTSQSSERDSKVVTESRVERNNPEHLQQMLLGVESSECVVDWKLDVRENHQCHRIGNTCGSIDVCPYSK